MGKAAHLLLDILLATVSGAAQTVEYLYSPGTNLERSELTQLDMATPLGRCGDVRLHDRYLAEELTTLAAGASVARSSAARSDPAGAAVGNLTVLLAGQP